jgi:Pyruvate/2-oxoacid:ferredoxin oxidoreductase gamma subunit/NAD-dependent dihydropyrimidine dehydrogenase PreA subunit
MGIRLRFPSIFLSGKSTQQRPAPGVNLISQKMGVHEWSYDNLVTIDLRQKCPMSTRSALKDRKVEVELGFDIDTAYREAERCLNCDVQTVFDGAKCIECDGCTDICPTDCINFIDNAEDRFVAPNAPPLQATKHSGSLRFGAAVQTERVMVKDENVCLHCGLMRRALPHGRLGYAALPLLGDQGRLIMQPKESINDFVIKFANVNGTGSASANGMFAKAIFRMGIPVSPRNIFPSNIQGLPTWYEVRVSRDGYLGRRGGIDMMVSVNPQSFAKDVGEVEPGGYMLYDSTKPLDLRHVRRDINYLGIPLTEMCLREYTDSRQRQLFKNVIYVGALAALLNIDFSPS